MTKLLILSWVIVVAAAFQPARKINIWMIGDSTMASKKPERDPESGWGVELATFFNSDVTVKNHAASGRSSKSFVSEKKMGGSTR